MENDKVLVTGGAGFVGSHVCEYFSNKGHDVIAVDSLERGKLLKKPINMRENVDYIKSLGNLEFEKVNILEKKRVEELCKKVDLIVHAASQTAVTTSLQYPEEDFEVNARGTFNVLEGARKSENNPTVIYCSTNKVYGNNINKIPTKMEEKRYTYDSDNYGRGVPEEMSIDLCEHTPYGCSKLLGDLYAQDYSHTYGLKTGVFRMSCIYGPRQYGVEDQGWVAWFIKAALEDKPIKIYGDGKQVRDVLYVTDLVKAFDLFYEKSTRHDVFNMGGAPENTLSLLELLGIIEEKLGKQPKVSFHDWRPSDQKVYISDISKAEKFLDWKPLISPEDGVSRLIDWFKNSD